MLSKEPISRPLILNEFRCKHEQKENKEVDQVLERVWRHTPSIIPNVQCGIEHEVLDFCIFQSKLMGESCQKCKVSFLFMLLGCFVEAKNLRVGTQALHDYRRPCFTFDES